MAAATEIKTGKDLFSDPVFKKLARLNGDINKMNKEQIKEKLEYLKLNTRGLKDVLKKRLKNYYKRKHLLNAHVRNQDSETKYKFLLVIDFEATCERGNSNYPHEIIEFPIVVVDVEKRTVVEEFHSYVKPVVNQTLTSFCTELTSITQDLVNNAPTFPDVLNQIQQWMDERQIGRENRFAVVTDGPWDMSRFMFLQCRSSKVAFPKWARRWINIRKSYCNSYQMQKVSITTMLDGFGFQFEGHQHSGIDDARNIARIVIQMLEDGCSLHVNERILARKLNNVNSAVRLAEVLNVARGASDSSDEGGESDDDESENVQNVDSSEVVGDLEGGKTIRTSNVEDIVENREIDDCSDLLQYISLRNS